MTEPISFETMTDRRLNHLETTLTDIQTMIKKLYGAVAGDDEFDQQGLIARIKKLENDSQELKNFKAKMLGLAAGVGAVSAVLFEVIKILVRK